MFNPQIRLSRLFLGKDQYKTSCCIDPWLGLQSFVAFSYAIDIKLWYHLMSDIFSHLFFRSYPKVIVSLCIVAGLVIPVLSPFVFYFLFQSRLDWSKGKYNKSHRRVNQAANITLAGVVILVMLSLITILIVGVIAFQQSSAYSVNFNTSYQTAELEKSKSILKSKLLNMTTPTVLTTSLNRSRISESENNKTKMISQSEHLLQTGRPDDVPINVAPNSYKPTSDNRHSKKKKQNTKDSMINFDTLKDNKWKFKPLNDTNVFLYNPLAGQNHTGSLLGFTLPDQQK